MTLSAALLEHWVFGVFLCKLVNFTPTLTALVSTFTVAVISVERWFFIVNKQKFHRHCTILTLVLLWLVSILIALPEFISRQVQEFVPPIIYPYMLNNYSSSLKFNQNSSNTSYIPTDYYPLEQPCQMKKIVYCVLEPGLRMRIFSYIVITVQYLVPFFFVSISCYLISRFLKKRMKRMCVYQRYSMSAVPTSASKRRKSKSPNTTDEITEHESIHFPETPITTNANGTKSNNFLARFRQSSQTQEQLNYRTSMHIADQQHYLKSQSHTKRRFHRSRKLLICIAVLFTTSWLPLTIVQIYLEHNEEILYTRDGANFVYGFLLIPCYLISSLSAWFNPVIYNYINRSFRREFYALYSCYFKVSSSSAPTSRRESTTPTSKRNRREMIHNEESTMSTAMHSTAKQVTHVVSFADEKLLLTYKKR